MPYWSTSGLSTRDQASYWGDVVCEAFTPLAPQRGRAQTARSATPDGIPGWVRSEVLVETNCAEISSCTQLLTHGPREVRRAPLDAVFVNLQLEGTCYGEQDGRRCIVRPGSYAVFDTGSRTTRPVGGCCHFAFLGIGGARTCGATGRRRAPSTPRADRETSSGQ
uniref:AraC-like ligand-binding domain-containing protein n=1 Tax=Rhodococcus wratislaviensis TaxID=44752 RepID=UPI003F814633